MNIINLTPHAITFLADDNTIQKVIAPSGTIARASQQRTREGYITTGDVEIPVSKCYYGEVENLPEPKEGTIYVVSVLTAQACPTRPDVFITDDAVRDTDGRIIGCRGLAHV